MTHACCLDRVCDFGEQLLVFGGIFASYEDFDGESAALDLVEVFRWENVSVDNGRVVGLEHTFLLGCEDVQGIEGE